MLSQYLYFFIPSIIIVSLWLMYMILIDGFHIVTAHWPFAVTMILGGFMSGATSEGSGALTFPIFTKVLQVEPQIARNFGWLMQAVGMGTASVLIFKFRIPFVWQAVIVPAFTGFFGMAFATHYLQPFILPAYAKITFTMVTASFGFVLFWENRAKEVHRNDTLRGLAMSDAAILGFGGFLGGVVFGIVGTGLDLIVFAILVNYYRISEKVATPTSVVLQAIACLGTVGYHEFRTHAYSNLSPVLYYWLACIPASAIMAPIGALVAAKVSRKQVAYILLALISVELVSTLWIVRFDDKAKLFAPAAFVALTLGFLSLRAMGKRRGRTEMARP